MLIGTRRALFGARAACKYLLRATFNADDQGYTDAQVLDTLAEGVQAGQLTVVEVDGALAIVSNKCAFTAQTTPVWEDLGFYSQAITRAPGRAALCTLNLDILSKQAIYGWGTTPFTLNNNEGQAFLSVSAGIRFRYAGLNTTLDTYANATDYQLALVLGGYDSNGAPWRSGQAAASYLCGVAYFIKGGAFTDWTLLWRDCRGNTSTLYAHFLAYSTGGTLDDFRVPDRDYKAVFQPNNVSLYASAGELSAYTPELGGGWTEDIGDWDTAGGVLTATALGIATFTGLADCLYDTEITMPGAGVTPGGLVLRGTDYTGGSEDYWYVKCTPATAGNDFELIEYVGGAATQRAVDDADFVASVAYRVAALCHGTTITCLAFVPAANPNYMTYAAAVSGQTATDFGLRDEGNGNMTFDKTALYPRTSSAYNALNNS